MSNPERRSILIFLAWLALRDGEMTENELAFLKNVSSQMGVSKITSMDKLPAIRDPEIIVRDLKSVEGKNRLLELALQMSFADGVYDARERAALMKTAGYLGMPMSAVEQLEHNLTEKLNSQLVEVAAQGKREKSEDWDWGKIATIAGVTVAGGAAVALTGGLAAPIIGGAIGSSLLGLSGAAATSAGLAFLGGGSLAAGGAGMAGGIALVTTALGGCGAATAAWKAKHLIGDIKEWEIQHIDGHGLHICLGISGFLQQDQYSSEIWTQLYDAFPESCNYALIWESKAQRDLGKVITAVAGKGMAGFGIAGLAQSATKKAFGMAALPVTVLSAMDIIDNPWSVAKNRAEQAGQMLGDYIADNQFGGLPVTLAGYSLGTRVIAAALKRLEKRNELGKIYDVYLMGSALSCNDPILTKLPKVIAGKLVNVYSKKDLVLTYTYRTAEMLDPPAGLQAIDLEGVINIDVTDTVGGHLDYPKKLDTILAEIRSRRHSVAEDPHKQRRNSSSATSDSTNKPKFASLKEILDAVPGMTTANKKDFPKAKLHIKFKNGLGVHTWKNLASVDHVFITNAQNQCIYGGYVGWVHADGFEKAMDKLGRLGKQYGAQIWERES